MITNKSGGFRSLIRQTTLPEPVQEAGEAFLSHADKSTIKPDQRGIQPAPTDLATSRASGAHGKRVRPNPTATSSSTSSTSHRSLEAMRRERMELENRIFELDGNILKAEQRVRFDSLSRSQITLQIQSLMKHEKDCLNRIEHVKQDSQNATEPGANVTRSFDMTAEVTESNLASMFFSPRQVLQFELEAVSEQIESLRAVLARRPAEQP